VAEGADRQGVLQQPDDERIEGGKLKQPRHILERRFAQDQFLAVVEADRLARQDDQRQPNQTQNCQLVIAENGDADKQSQRRGGHVRNRQKAPLHRFPAKREPFSCLDRGPRLGSLCKIPAASASRPDQRSLWQAGDDLPSQLGLPGFHHCRPRD